MDKLWNRHPALAKGTVEGTASGPFYYGAGGEGRGGTCLCEFSALLFGHSCCSGMSNSLPPMDCSTPGFPVLHYLQEFTQTHVH